MGWSKQSMLRLKDSQSIYEDHSAYTHNILIVLYYLPKNKKIKSLSGTHQPNINAAVGVALGVVSIAMVELDKPGIIRIDAARGGRPESRRRRVWKNDKVDRRIATLSFDN